MRTTKKKGNMEIMLASDQFAELMEIVASHKITLFRCKSLENVKAVHFFPSDYVFFLSSSGVEEPGILVIGQLKEILKQSIPLQAKTINIYTKSSLEDILNNDEKTLKLIKMEKIEFMKAGKGNSCDDDTPNISPK